MGLSRAERAATDIVLRHRQGTSRNHRRSRPRFSDANLRVTTRSVYSLLQDRSGDRGSHIYGTTHQCQDDERYLASIGSRSSLLIDPKKMAD